MANPGAIAMARDSMKTYVWISLAGRMASRIRVERMRTKRELYKRGSIWPLKAACPGPNTRATER